MSGSDQESYVRNTQRAAELESRKERIRSLNDRFRNSLSGGHVMLTLGVRALGPETVNEVVTTVREYAKFDADDDPYGEHDFGAITCQRQRVFWKIDYYGLDLDCGSPDPADPSVTTRVMTIMLASEY